MPPIAAVTTVMHDMSGIKENREKNKGITASVTAMSTIATAEISITRETFR